MVKKKSGSVPFDENRKEYIGCRVEIIGFDSKDVLTTSGGEKQSDDFGGIHDDWLTEGE